MIFWKMIFWENDFLENDFLENIFQKCYIFCETNGVELNMYQHTKDYIENIKILGMILHIKTKFNSHIK